MTIAIIDNYDSFTFNLFHYVEMNASKCFVFRNDCINYTELDKADKIILSPGPGLPKDAGDLMKVIEKYEKSKPILGVCLGLQAITEFYGGKLLNLKDVLHGMALQTNILDKNNVLFKNINENTIQTGHYHSWVADKKDFPKTLQITSEDEQGNIMSISHKTLPIHAVQFHPESILTPNGKTIIQNWINS